MAWVKVGLGVASLAGGLFGSKSAKKLQKESLALQRDSLNFAKQRYNDYQTQYGGINDLVIADAEKGVQADLGKVTTEASADTATAYANAKQALDNQNQRMGINPNSGRAESSNRQLALGQAMTTAGNVTNARNTERKNASDTTWNRRYGVYTQGNNLISNAANAVTNASNTLAGSYDTAATNASNTANQAIAGGISSMTQGLLSDKGLSTIQSLLKKGTTTTQPISSINDATMGLKVDGTSLGSGVMYDNIASTQRNNNNSYLG